MPTRRIKKASTQITTAWKKRERRTFIGSFQGEQEGDHVDVLLGRQARAQVLGHDAGREAGHGADALGIDDLPLDVVGRLDLGDLREVGPERRGVVLAGFVAGVEGALAMEDMLALRCITWY